MLITIINIIFFVFILSICYLKVDDAYFCSVFDKNHINFILIGGVDGDSAAHCRHLANFCIG